MSVILLLIEVSGVDNLKNSAAKFNSVFKSASDHECKIQRCLEW